MCHYGCIFVHIFCIHQQTKVDPNYTTRCRECIDIGIVHDGDGHDRFTQITVLGKFDQLPVNVVLDDRIVGCGH